MSDVTVTFIGPDEMLARAAELARIHQLAFGETHDRAVRYREDSLPQMSRASGLVALIAARDERPVGFALGHDAVAIEPWFRSAMWASRGTPVEAWLPGAWYFADIAVHPDHQRHGIGTLLHDRIMASVTDRRCVLVTFHGDHPAKRFYRRLGWHEAIPDLVWAPGKPLTSLMEYTGTPRSRDP